MTTHTIEVTEIDEEMLKRLDNQIEQQQIQDRATYIREVLRHDLERRTRPVQEKTFAEILAPIHESIREASMSEEEVIALFDTNLADVRRERRNRKIIPSPGRSAAGPPDGYFNARFASHSHN